MKQLNIIKVFKNYLFYRPITHVYTCWISPTTQLIATITDGIYDWRPVKEDQIEPFKSFRESTLNLAAIRIQTCYRQYLIRRHYAAYVIQKWYIACSYRM